MSRAPIFVVGPPRTGTTLTARILSRHPVIHISPIELFFFQRLYERRRRIGAPDGSEATAARFAAELRKLAYKKRSERAYWQALDRVFADPDFATRLRQARSYGEVLEAFMSAQAAEFGKTRWGNQTPTDLFSLDEIMTSFADAKIVVCTRHPFDFLVSNRERAARALRRNKPTKAWQSQIAYHPALTSMLWRICMNRAARALDTWPDRVMVSRYEDLVGKAGEQVHRLCEFLDVAFEPSMLKVQVHNSSRDVKEKGIFTTSVGQWRTALGPGEIYTCQVLCRRYMTRHGYEPADIGPQVGAIAKNLGTAPAALVRLIRHRWRLNDGDLPFTLKRFIN